jgi:DNA-binding NarL/FixJ family response regulator
VLRDGMSTQLSGLSAGRMSGGAGRAPIGVVLLDQTPLFREGLSQRILHEAGMTLVGATGHPNSAMRLRERSRTDVLVVDAMLDPGAHLVHLLTAADPALCALMLVREPFRTARFVSAMRSAGVHGLVPHSAPPELVIEAIRRTHADRRYLDPTLMPLLAGVGATARSGGRGPLSNREFQVLQLVADGLPNQAIAQSLFVSVETVRTHIKGVLRKLGARDRAHAVAIGFRSGVLGAVTESPVPREPVDNRRATPASAPAVAYSARSIR